MNVQADKVETFKTMARELSTSVEAEEPETRSYEWYLSDDGAECYFTELLADSDALMAHLAHVGQAVGPPYAVAPIAEVVVFGSPSAKVGEVLAGLGARCYPRLAGFVR